MNQTALNKWGSKWLLLGTAVLASCSGSSSSSDSTATSASVVASSGATDVQYSPRPVIPLHKIIAQYPTMDSAWRDSVRSLYSDALDVLLQARGVTSGPTDRAVMELASTDAVKVFSPDIDRLIPSLIEAENALGRAHAVLAQELPAIPQRSIYSFVAPIGTPVMMMDIHPDVLLLGLNHFLGSDYEGYRGFPNYTRIAKTEAFIPIAVSMAEVSTAYPYEQTDESTALSRMIYEGAVVEAAMRAVDRASLDKVLGWTPQQVAWAIENESTAWRTMIERKLLYSTDSEQIGSLVSPAQSTPLLTAEAPGAFGRFIGYRIVDNYLKNNPSASLKDVLSPDFYNDPSVLAKSGYSPR